MTFGQLELEDELAKRVRARPRHRGLAEQKRDRKPAPALGSPGLVEQLPDQRGSSGDSRRLYPEVDREIVYLRRVAVASTDRGFERPPRPAPGSCRTPGCAKDLPFRRDLPDLAKVGQFDGSDGILRRLVRRLAPARSPPLAATYGASCRNCRRSRRDGASPPLVRREPILARGRPDSRRKNASRPTPWDECRTRARVASLARSTPSQRKANVAYKGTETAGKYRRVN